MKHGMIGRADAAQRQHSPSETAKPTAMLNLHVDEIDAHYQRAVSQGARIVTELEDTFWGYRRYKAVDSEGNRWHIMQKLTHQAAIRVESIYSRKSIIDGRLVQLEMPDRVTLHLSSRTQFAYSGRARELTVISSTWGLASATWGLASATWGLASAGRSS
jgi:hypothetical protein